MMKHEGQEAEKARGRSSLPVPIGDAGKIRETDGPN